ncbi:hypothetical protein BC332_01206 [Capsicum chinense]|nr:hypothetical protein BC332_01206 [Capsicum chinense]
MCVWLRNELLFMQSFLGDAEEKQSGDHRVQQWVSETNDVANDVVAVLETHSFEAGEVYHKIYPMSHQGKSDLLEKMTETDLESHLRDLLKENKYLVVDDIWHRGAWESLKRTFPDSTNGSRMIITTPKEDVAERAKTVIRAETIMWLWMAEDFIPNEERMEDVPEGFLNELIRRSLVQVAFTRWGKVVKRRDS